MTPGARLSATIDLTDIILDSGRPADAVSSSYFRERRYIGSKDRKAIAEAVYGLLRRYGRLSWHLKANRVRLSGRALVFANAALFERRSVDWLAAQASGAKYHPAQLDREERRFLARLEKQPTEPDEMPERVRLECPQWAHDRLTERFGEATADHLASMMEPAALHVRSNPLKASREAVSGSLADEGIVTTPGRLSPFALLVEGRPALTATETYKTGAVEIQDEGSQLVAMLAAALPGQAVADFCAGAGGKTLLIAALMTNKGTVSASDVLAGRLLRSRQRLARAGVDTVRLRPLKGENDPWVKRNKGKFDRVLVDAPCSGTGTWRRNPDMRWRPLGPELESLLDEQGRILASAARLVKPGGRLIYATCSLLAAENEDQVGDFLESQVGADFRVLPIAEAWAEMAERWPELGPLPCDGPYLSLTPLDHGTDGFFAAVLERQSGT